MGLKRELMDRGISEDGQMANMNNLDIDVDYTVTGSVSCIRINADGITCASGNTFHAIEVDFDGATVGGTLYGLYMNLPEKVEGIHIVAEKVDGDTKPIVSLVISGTTQSGSSLDSITMDYDGEIANACSVRYGKIDYSSTDIGATFYFVRNDIDSGFVAPTYNDESIGVSVGGMYNDFSPRGVFGISGVYNEIFVYDNPTPNYEYGPSMLFINKMNVQADHTQGHSFNWGSICGLLNEITFAGDVTFDDVYFDEAELFLISNSMAFGPKGLDPDYRFPDIVGNVAWIANHCSQGMGYVQIPNEWPSPPQNQEITEQGALMITITGNMYAIWNCLDYGWSGHSDNTISGEFAGLKNTLRKEAAAPVAGGCFGINQVLENFDYGMYTKMKGTVPNVSTWYGFYLTADEVVCGAGESYYGIYVEMDGMTVGGTIAAIACKVKQAMTGFMMTDGTNSVTMAVNTDGNIEVNASHGSIYFGTKAGGSEGANMVYCKNVYQAAPWAENTWDCLDDIAVLEEINDAINEQRIPDLPEEFNSRFRKDGYYDHRQLEALQRGAIVQLSKRVEELEKQVRS